MTSPPGTSIPIAVPPVAAQRRSSCASRTSPRSSDCLRECRTPRSNSRRRPKCPPSGPSAANSNGSAATANAGNSSPGTATWPQSPGQHRATILPAACGLASATQPTHRALRTNPTPIAPPAEPIHLRHRPRRPRRAPEGRARRRAQPERPRRRPNLSHRRRARLPTPRSPASKSTTSCRCARSHSRSTCATASIGQLEIKKRGVDIDPEKLRRDLKLRGDNAATLAHHQQSPAAPPRFSRTALHRLVRVRATPSPHSRLDNPTAIRPRPVNNPTCSSS